VFQTPFSSICILDKAMYWKVLCQINRIYWAHIHPPVDDLWQFKCHYFGPQKPEESWRSVTLVESYWSLPPFQKIYGQILSLAIFCGRFTHVRRLSPQRFEPVHSARRTVEAAWRPFRTRTPGAGSGCCRRSWRRRTNGQLEGMHPAWLWLTVRHG
jgi:hypothetical protein